MMVVFLIVQDIRCQLHFFSFPFFVFGLSNYSSEFFKTNRSMRWLFSKALSFGLEFYPHL